MYTLHFTLHRLKYSRAPNSKYHHNHLVGWSPNTFTVAVATLDISLYTVERGLFYKTIYFTVHCALYNLGITTLDISLHTVQTTLDTRHNTTLFSIRLDFSLHHIKCTHNTALKH